MRVAITGGIAEGKSTVLSALASVGYDVVSADAIAREVFEEPATQAALARLMGESGPVDRARLRELIGRRPELRREVNRIMHPTIRHRMAASPARFFEIPLLVEGGMAHRYDYVWVVTCGPELQRQRLIARVGSETEADRLIATQLPTSVKIPFADWVVDTRILPETVAALVQQKAVSLDL